MKNSTPPQSEILGANDLVFRQIPMGPMANFVYLIGSRRAKTCLLVDPAWEVEQLLQLLQEEELELAGVLATHYHPDHVGGSVFGLSVRGLPQLLERVQVPVHVNTHEAEGIKVVTGLSESDLVRHESGDVIELGDVTVRLIHTPGHTPGSQCFLIERGTDDAALVSGDTLFIGACGRVDLPGGNSQQLYESLTQKLAKLPPQTILYPGHDYSDRSDSTIAQELRTNRFLRVSSLDDWMRLMGPL